jgi:hypothetical protein
MRVASRADRLVCLFPPAGKVERVRFSKDGTMLQLTAIDGRRATVVLPNDPDLVDILARNGVDISVSEGDQQGESDASIMQATLQGKQTVLA